jgi:GNAT superfamily N-acetyltransferase
MFYEDECIAFNSFIKFPHAKVKNLMMAHRLVVHPDYQGLGIGGRFADWTGAYLRSKGYRYRFCIASPVMINMFANSKKWALVRGRVTGSNLKSGPKADPGRAKAQMKLRRMSTMSFEYVERGSNGAR